MNSRNPTADLLKGVAVVLMIQVHLFEQFATLDISQSTIGKVSLFLGGPPAAPVFLAVMGFFIARSHRTFLQHVVRGLLLLLGGILLNVGLNANLLYSIRQGRFQLDPFAFIFGADILPLAGLSIIAIALLRRLFRDNSLAYFAVALVVASVTPFLGSLKTQSSLTYVVPFLWGNQWWSYFPLFPWLAYSLLGVSLGISPAIFDAVASLNSRIIQVLSLVLCVALLLTLDFAGHSITELPIYYHHSILLVLWISGFLILWLFVFSKLESVFGNSWPLVYCKWLGQSVTAAYVFQWLLIGNLATELYRTQSLAQIMMWFVAILSATSLLIVLFRSMREKILNRQF